MKHNSQAPSIVTYSYNKTAADMIQQNTRNTAKRNTFHDETHS